MRRLDALIIQNARDIMASASPAYIGNLAVYSAAVSRSIKQANRDLLRIREAIRRYKA